MLAVRRLIDTIAPTDAQRHDPGRDRGTGKEGTERVVHRLVAVRMEWNFPIHIARRPARNFLKAAPGSRRSCCIAYSKSPVKPA